eukprot:Selendium_serpulae@DN6155_c0_g2_i3.p1
MDNGLVWVLRPSHGLFASCVLSTIFGGAKFLKPCEGDRDEKKVVCVRFCSAICICVTAATLLYAFASQTTPDEVAGASLSGEPTFSVWMGVSLEHSRHLRAIMVTWITLVTLFAGKIYVISVFGFKRVMERRKRWETIRDLVFAPISEELVFRGLITILLLSSGFSRPYVAVIGTLLFVFAHFMDLILVLCNRSQVEELLPRLRVAIRKAIPISLFSAISYALLFRTGSIASPWFAHVFCNYVGGPIFMWDEGRDKRFASKQAIGLIYGAGIVFSGIILFVSTERMSPQYGYLQELIKLRTRAQAPREVHNGLS